MLKLKQYLSEYGFTKKEQERLLAGEIVSYVFGEKDTIDETIIEYMVSSDNVLMERHSGTTKGCFFTEWTPQY